MRNTKVLFLLPILFVCMYNNTNASDKIGSLKLVIDIDATYKQINIENWQTLLNGKLEQEPNLSKVFTLLKNGALPTVFYTKDLHDPTSPNILINQMEGYSKIDESIFPKINASMAKLNTFTWNKIEIIQTSNNIKAIKLSGYIDKSDPEHRNITYWLEDSYQRRWISFSFNNIDYDEITSIINSVGFYLTAQEPLSEYYNKVFSISYPKSWNTTKQDNSVTFMAVEAQKNQNDFLKENLAIYIETADPKLTLKSIIESSVTSFIKEGRSMNDIVEQGVKRNRKLISYGLFKTKLAVKGHTIISTSVVFKNGNKLIMVTFTHDKAENTYYESLYNTIIDSFNLI